MYLPRIIHDIEAWLGSVEAAIADIFSPVISNIAASAGTLAKDVAASAVQGAIAGLGAGASISDILAAAERSALATLASEGKSVGEADLKAILAATLSAIRGVAAAS